METDALDMKRYESMKDTLKRGDDSTHDEIYDEVYSLIRRNRDLKPHEEELVEAVLEKVAEGTPNGRGNQNRLALKLKEGLDSYEVNDERMLGVLGRIAEMPNANITARIYAVEAIFDNAELNVTASTVRFVESLVEQGVPEDPEDFSNRTIGMAIRAAEQVIGHDKPRESGQNSLYKMFVKKAAEGKLPQKMVRGLVSVMAEKWGYQDFDNLKMIKESEKLPADIREKARVAMESPKPVKKISY
jgi:hypothetical protein